MSVAPDWSERAPRVDSTPPADAPEPATAPVAGQADMTGNPGRRALVYAVGAALVAGSLTWGVGEKTYGYYRPSAKAQPNPREFSGLNREMRIADQKNTAIAFGTFGAFLGMLCGAAGGASRRSIPHGVSAALAGLVLGGIGAAVAGYGLAPIFAHFYSDETQSLTLPFLIRGSIWAVAGMAAGLAFGGGWRGALGMTTGSVGGMCGSVCGTAAFEVVNAVLFPSDRNDAVIPSSTQARLLAYLLVSVAAAVGAVLVGGHRSSSNPIAQARPRPINSPEPADRGRG